MAVEAYILIHATAGKTEQVGRGVAAVEGVKSVHAVTGPYDIIAFAEAPDLQALLNLSARKIQEVAGVVSTVTCIAYKV